MIQYLLTFCYVVVCILLILSVLLQHYKSDAQKGSSSYFGGAGNKDFLYRSTKYLIVAFFGLAFLHTSMSYRHFQSETESYPIPLSLPKSPELPKI